MLYKVVESGRAFRYLSDKLGTSGGCQAAVTAGTI